MPFRYFPLILILTLFACRNAPPAETPKPAVDEKTEIKVPERPVYRSSYTRKVDLIHTRLNVRPDFRRKELTGDAAIILKPHFYNTDSLVLNARGMELKEVSMMSLNRRVPLKYSYDSTLIRIKLDKTYTRDESFIVFIEYVSRPERLSASGSEAIAESKGLYFINADGKDKESPVQLWSQGETESNSAWFPTIEDPGQRMTQEIYITVDTAIKTLSNGLLLSSSNNRDGTRTDYWKQSLPAAPYLTMIAAGNFSIVKDTWKNIEVSYYVDPPYEKFAAMTFGNTPKMIGYFSDLLGIPFVWEKYSQIVVHDYISGAMENTTATVHGTNMQQDPREHADESNEEYISHELFHHWFGNLVTCESWSNVTLNEGFANYAEYLWREHANGKEEADYVNQADMNAYLFSVNENDLPLIRYEYENREDLYDVISYNKGGRVLHMLRSYVGDDAFFLALHNYISGHMFSTVEIDDLRMAFEKVTGEDLHWFFDQWFMKGGHPTLRISYEWSDSLKTETVTIVQKQDAAKAPLYRLPLTVDIYSGGNVERKNIVVERWEQKFTFPLSVKPSLVNVDAQKTLLCNKQDEKPAEWLIFQYDHSPLYLDKYEAITGIGQAYKAHSPGADMILRALKDKFHGLRKAALDNAGEIALNHPDTIKTTIIELATKDPDSDVRVKALSVLAKYFSYSENASVFSNALNDSSYRVAARAFKIINEKDSAHVAGSAALLLKDSSGTILSHLSEYFKNSADDQSAFFRRAFRCCDSYGRYTLVNNLEDYITQNASADNMRNGIQVMIEQANKPQVSFVKSAVRNSLDAIERSLKNQVTALQDSIDKPGSRTTVEIESRISQLNSIRQYLTSEVSGLPKSTE